MSLLFGRGVETRCIDTTPLTLPDGDQGCVGYRLTYYGAGLPAYVRDDGYVVISTTKHVIYTLDDATIALGQKQGILPTPMPPYKVPASTYAYGFSLVPVLVIVVLLKILGRRWSRRTHEAQRAAATADSTTTGIEVAATYNFIRVIGLWPMTITIDGVRHKRAWGTWTFDVAPGPHRITGSYWWIWDRGEASVTLDVEAGTIARVGYHVGLVSSAMKVEPAMPTARVESSKRAAT